MDDGLRRLDGYKEQIRRIFAQFTDKTQCWKTQTPGRHVQHFYCARSNLHKMEALLACSPDRLYQLCADRHYVTRSQWDGMAREMCPSQQEHFETRDGHIYVLTGDIVQWVRPASIVMFLTKRTQMCTWIKRVDDKAFLIVIANVKITLDTTAHQVVAQDLTRFNEIYRPWDCEFCRKSVPAHELYCRSCKKERYARCPDLACYEPQMKGATQCWKCKNEIVGV